MTAGYTQPAILEVLMGVGLKTFSNYVNHVTETPLDEAFQHNAYTPAARRAA
jgi:alkylhydroperoxidase family enzyme